MAAFENFEFRLGADWVIVITCQDASEQPLTLTGGDVRFRMASDDAVLIDLDSGDGVTLGASPGNATIAVRPAKQTQINPGVYAYEIWAVLQDQSISDQLAGVITVVGGPFDL